jgi:hypothetical protein
MGLWIGLGFPGDLAGDFWVDAADDGFGDTARLVCTRAGLASLLPCTSVDELASVPLLGPLGGGGELPSLSEESTMGCLRAARDFTMPPQLGRAIGRSAAS